MGNHLHILAKAWSIKLLALDQYDINAKLVFRHQTHTKWVRGRDAIHQCFPNLRQYNFSAANTQAFDELAKKQDQVLRQEQWDPSRLYLDTSNETTIREALSYWKSMLESTKLSKVQGDGSVPVTIPFLKVPFWCPHELLDHNLDEIRSLFELDNKSECCRMRPDPDETVFHLRNFLVEMPRVGRRKGYEELSPNKTAFELFAHLKSGDKIAITTRFGGDKVQPYVDAFQARGLQVRVVENQTGTQDFCFLQSAQKELVGTLMSTYAFWAAYLGDMKRANLYQVISPNSRELRPFNWTHPLLKDRVISEAFKSEEQEEMETNERDGITGVQFKNRGASKCECPTCNATALAFKATKFPFTCKDRIEYLMARYGSSESQACSAAVESGACTAACDSKYCNE